MTTQVTATITIAVHYGLHWIIVLGTADIRHAHHQTTAPLATFRECKLLNIPTTPAQTNTTAIAYREKHHTTRQDAKHRLTALVKQTVTNLTTPKPPM